MVSEVQTNCVPLFTVRCQQGNVIEALVRFSTVSVQIAQPEVEVSFVVGCDAYLHRHDSTLLVAESIVSVRFHVVVSDLCTIM